MTSHAAVAAQRLLLPRTGRETLLALLILVLLPFFFISGPAWLATDAGRALANLGHIPFFSLVTLVIHSRWPLTNPARWLGATAIVLCFSIAIELVQSQVGRTASLHDVLRNLTGAWLVIFWFERGRPAVWLGRLVASSLLLFELFLFASSGFAHYQMSKQLPLLAGLEKPGEIKHWRAVNSSLERSGEVSTEGAYALKVYMRPGRHSGMALTLLPRNWEAYHQLHFDLHNPDREALSVTLRIHDARHEQGEQGWRHGDRFNRSFVVEPGWNHFSVALGDVELAPQQRSMDMRMISEIRFFVSDIKKPKVVYVDNLRLAGD